MPSRSTAGRTGAFPRRAADLLPELRDALRREGDVAPSEESVRVLGRVVAGYLRTSPLTLEACEGARWQAVSAFAAAYPRWWQSGGAPYPLVAGLLDDVFHQRKIAPPRAEVLAALHRLAAGILRRKAAPATRAAQLAVADWLASLYLAGSLE